MTPKRENDIKRTFDFYRSRQWYGHVLRLPKLQSDFYHEELQAEDITAMSIDIFEYRVCKDVLYDRGEVVAKRYRVMCENVVVDEQHRAQAIQNKKPALKLN